jgi:hypothetical protein
MINQQPKSDDLEKERKALESRINNISQEMAKLQLAFAIPNINLRVNKLPMVQFSAPLQANSLGMADKAEENQPRHDLDARLYDDIIHQAANHCAIC